MALSQTPGAPQKNDDLTNLNLDDLSKMTVTTASKKAQSFNSVPAAIYVVTSEDIKRMGAKNVPEALRMVPGVEVFRLSAETYAVSVRGFNSYNSNKLLVLVDGRTIYSPYISGTYWEVEDFLMEDIDRIEVIRGPGGSLWGANAVDGIINIITKHSKDTLGGLFTAEGGNLETNRLGFRWGGKIGDYGTYRISGQSGVDSDLVLSNGGGRAGDGKNLNDLSFRADLDAKKTGKFTFEGTENRTGLYENTNAPIPVSPYSLFTGQLDHVTTSSLLGRWEHDENAGAQTALQVYYNMLDYPFSYQGLSGYTWDFDLQHQMATMKNQSITVGAGYRQDTNQTWRGIAGWLDPSDEKVITWSAFAQDDILLAPKNHLSLGLKYENDTITGNEFQPNARYSYTPDDNRTLWASVARAVRTPGQFDRSQVDFTAVGPATGGSGGNPTASVIYGNNNLVSETLVANEIGYRFKPTEKLMVDVATYYNIYNDLLYYTTGTPFTGTVLGSNEGSTYPIGSQDYYITPTYTNNGDRGHTYGVEMATHYNPSNLFRATLSYTYLQHDHFLYGTPMDSPVNQVGLHLSWDLPHDFKLDTLSYFYDKISDLGVPAYFKQDINLSWRPNKTYEISGGVSDLFSQYHQESIGIFWQPTDIPRSYYAKMTLHF